MHENDLFKSSDLALVSYLTLQFSIFDTSREANKIIFGFLSTPELEEAVESYWNGTTQVEPKEYFNSIKSIKARVYQYEY